MKHYSLTFAAAALLLLSASCRTAAPAEEDAPAQTFTADIASPDTRTALTPAFKTVWSAGDEIRIFSASAPEGKVYVTDSTAAGSSTARFSGPALGEGPYYAVYPASAGLQLTDTTLVVDIPSTQKYVPGNISAGAAIAVSRSEDSHLKFSNLCGILRIGVTGSFSIASAQLSTLGEESLWGRTAVTFGQGVPTAAPATSGGSTITLECPSCVQLCDSASFFHFVVPALSLAEGFTIRLEDTQKGACEKTSSANAGGVPRSAIVLLPDFRYLQTESAFCNLTNYGAYDLSDPANPSAIRTYVKKKDQYSKHEETSTHTFRIMNPGTGEALSIAVPANLEEGDECKATIKAAAIEGLSSQKRKVLRLMKQTSGRRYFVDDENSIGYIVIR